LSLPAIYKCKAKFASRHILWRRELFPAFKARMVAADPVSFYSARYLQVKKIRLQEGKTGEW